jgi:hypothetical protein
MHRLILGCILASILGGAIAVAQSPVTSTKPLTTPGMNQPLLVPPPTTSKNSPSPAGSGLGLGVQIVPGVSPVTNPQASKGGSDAEKIHKAETRVTVRGFDKVDRLTRGGKSSEEAKGKSTDKSKWGPGYTPDKSSTDKSKFGTWGPGYTPDKSSNDKSRYGTYGPGYTPDKSSADKSKFGTWGPGYTSDSSSKDGSTTGKSQSENQDGDKQTQSSQTPSQ